MLTNATYVLIWPSVKMKFKSKQLEKNVYNYICSHSDDQVNVHFTWWRNQMETFSVLLALCEGKPLVTSWFPSQRPVMQSFDVFLSAPEQLIEQTIETLVIWDAITLIVTPL